MISDDYYKKMMIASTKRNTCETRIKAYQAYLDKLKKIVPLLPPIYGNLINAENFFLSGGYVSDGQSLSRGELVQKAGVIEKANDTLNNIIAKTQYSIEDMNKTFSQLTREYEEAKRNYNNAREAENIV